MTDQAALSRTIMNRVHRPDTPTPPRTIAIAGGRSGVGITSISVNLAIAMAQQGQRTVILDADLTRAQVADLCGMRPACTIADVLAGKRGIHEVLERGPGGIQLVAGSNSPQCRSLCSARAIGRLLDQMRALGRHTDVVVIDIGSSPTDLMSRLWHAVDRVLVMTTPDQLAMMDGYALIKSLAAGAEERRPLSLVVNQVGSESLALDIYGRMDRSCRRFLGLGLELGGWLPMVSRRTEATGVPWVLTQPPLEFASHIERIASRLLSGQDDPVYEAA
jgi:flagellar biosynthesis protein FlhG